MLAPSVPPAPPRLFTTMVLPVTLANWADKGRAKASVPPPAGKGTIKVTGLVGQEDCASAANGQAATPVAPTRISRRRMVLLLIAFVSSLLVVEKEKI